MVSRKSSTPDLIAIYRLEFYRKQKNWELSASKHRDKTHKHQQDKSRCLLDTTYNLDDYANERTKIDPLNVAFCELDLDQHQKSSSVNKETKLQKHKRLTQDWLEPINIWPDNVKNEMQCAINNNIPKATQGTPKKTWIQERLQILMKAAKNGDLDIQSEPALDIPPIEPQQLNPQIEPELEYEFDCDEDSCLNWDCMECSKDNPDKVCSEPGWMDTALLVEDVWQRECDVKERLGASASAWRWSDDLLAPRVAEVDADMSLGSVGEFIRGAHMAPHSSELELDKPTSASAGAGAGADAGAGAGAGAEALHKLPAARLAAAVRSHELLLARLLREAARRREIQKSLSFAAYSDFSSFEEFPTRDVGPAPAGDAGPHARDAVLAGSHRVLLDRSSGRGRGRLPNGS